MKKIIKSLQTFFSHFQTKLLCAFLFCTLIPLGLMGGISYLVSYRIAQDKILEASLSSHQQIQLQLNNRIAQTENTADSLQYDMFSLNRKEKPMEVLEALTSTRNNVSLYKSTFDFYHISIFLPDYHIGSKENLYFFSLSQLKNFQISNEKLENPGTASIWFYQPEMHLPFLASYDTEPTATVGCCRILKDQGTQDTEYAYIIFLDTQEFSDFLKNSFHDSAISSYIISEDDNLIASSNSSLTAPDKNKLSYLMQHRNQSYKKDGIHYHVTQLQNGWYHITEIPESYIRKNIHVLINSILFTLLLSMPVTIFVVILFSRSLTRKIHILSKAMKNFQLKQNPKENTELQAFMKTPESCDEIDHLGRTFLNMQKSLDQNLQSILELSLAEEKLKYQLLQSQINPHFLYNILGSIQTCQKLGKLETADKMLTNLTHFYRMTLRKSNDLITIRDELEIARLYLEMEKLCLSKRLSWEIHEEDGIENFLICKFTLQPFLENSIHHGLSANISQLVIRMDICYGDDTVLITITDNGVGIAPRQLLELQNTLREKTVDYNRNFGIGNVNKRISNPYFGNGHISIESQCGAGTKITIEFDQLEEDDEKNNHCR